MKPKVLTLILITCLTLFSWSCQNQPAPTDSPSTENVMAAPVEITPTVEEGSTPESSTQNNTAPLLDEAEATAAAQIQIGEREVYCQAANEDAHVFFQLGIQAEIANNLAAAKEAYLKAIEFDPNYCDVFDNLGRVHRVQGDYEYAQYYYEKSIEIAPENPAPHINLAIVYLFQKETEKALAEYEFVVKTSPDNPEGHFGMGHIYTLMDRCDLAVDKFARAEEIYLAQNSPWVHDAQAKMGLCHYELGDFVEAKDYLEKAYDSHQDNADINFSLGIIYMNPRFENMVLAEQYIRRAQDLGKFIPDVIAKEFNLE